jgi:hypothetical protein
MYDSILARVDGGALRGSGTLGRLFDAKEDRQ